MTNSLRGEFAATIAGERIAFDTTLGTVARIEASCGDRSIMAVIGGVVTGRRAGDHIALLAAALAASGHSDPQAGAAATTVSEAEAFILALMGALGFTLVPRAGEGAAADPLDGSSAGVAGAPSRSAA